MSQIQVFIKALQDASASSEDLPVKFWPNYSADAVVTFQDVLNQYAEYYNTLTSAGKQAISATFWKQIKAMGTPVIERMPGSDDECAVYFLFPKDKLAKDKALYLQGDFHGYGSTDGRQMLTELSDTGIMWRKDDMPVDAVVVYRYSQVAPGSGGKKPTPERAPFFDEALKPIHSKKVNFPEISQVSYKDEYSQHRFPYPGFDTLECAFRVSADPHDAHIPGEPVDWPSLLSVDAPQSKHLRYHGTFYSDKAGELHLHQRDVPITKKYNDDLRYADGYKLSLKTLASFDALDTQQLGKVPYLIKSQETGSYALWGCNDGTWQLTSIESKVVPSAWDKMQGVYVSVHDPIFAVLKAGHTLYLPYAHFTRDIHVFKPASGQVDDVIVINDGIPYLITGVLENFESLISEHKLSSNTALVFVHTLAGLKAALPEGSNEAQAFRQDPSASIPGMGERLIDYKHAIDQYTDFIARELFPRLKKEINIPEDPRHRVMVGSSLSGTASIYIGAKRPDLFGAVVAQSPSPDNRAILSRIPSNMRTRSNIHLSCGAFEAPDYAASNANLEYAQELSHKLNIPLHVGLHGHQFLAWNAALEQALPEVLLQQLIQDNHVMGASVAVLEHEKINTVAAGKLVRGGDKNVTPDTVFEAASLSKPVFAYLVLKMVERGEIDLDKPLYELSKRGFGPPELRETSQYQKLTARMILSHQTGLPNWMPEEFQTEPQTQFNYSGLAYCFLCDVIQEISGQSLEQLAKRELEPLGIVQSSYFYQPEDGSGEKMRFAVGHNVEGASDKRSHYPRISEANAEGNVYPANPAASLFITAENYSKFLTVCMKDKFIRERMCVSVNNLGNGRDQKALKEGVSSEMLEKLHWGLGMGIQFNEDGSKTLFHWGDSETFRNLATIRLAKDGSYKGVVCLTNSANGPGIFRQLVEPIVGSIEPIATWLRAREKLNVNQDSFVVSAEEHTQHMKEQLKAIQAGGAKPDLTSSPRTGHTPNFK